MITDMIGVRKMIFSISSPEVGEPPSLPLKREEDIPILFGSLFRKRR
jgi:hypothetical protein